MNSKNCTIRYETYNTTKATLVHKVNERFNLEQQAYPNDETKNLRLKPVCFVIETNKQIMS